jgi:hypothetical protein
MKHTLHIPENFASHTVIRWHMKLHRWTWKDVRRRYTGPNGRWLRPQTDGIELFSLATVPLTRTSTGATRAPAPGSRLATLTAGTAESPLLEDQHYGFGERLRSGLRAIRHRAPRPTQPLLVEGYGHGCLGRIGLV